MLSPMRWQGRAASIGRMRLSLAVVASLLVLAAPAGATQLSYVDQGQIWVSTLDGAQKRPISGPAPIITPGESRSWTEQAQSDDGFIVGVARESGHSGAAAPTWVWNPSGTVVAKGTLGYDNNYNNGGLALPVTLDLVPGAAQLLYTYSDLVYSYPVSSLYRGTWIGSTANTSVQPFDIPDLIGSSLLGGRWVGVNAHAASGDDNIVAGDGAFSTSGHPWFRAYGATAVDVAANGTVAGVIYEIGNSTPYALALFATAGPDAPASGASCDMPTVGNVGQVSISQDGRFVAWTDSRGLLIAPTPPLGSGSPCPLVAAPTVISATGSYPSIGASTLATPASAPPSSGSTTTAPAPAGSTPAPAGGVAPGRATARPSVRLARSVKASTFATGLTLRITIARAGAVTATARVGTKMLAKKTVRATKPGTVKVKLKASRTLRRKLRGYRGRTLTIAVKGPGGNVTIKRKLR